jgi:predicted nucleic acid-binding protein
MRAVLDTNVLISSVISTGVPHTIVTKGFEEEYQIIVSVATLAEFRTTLQKYPDRFGMSDTAIQKEVETIRYFATFVDPDHERSTNI